MEELNDEIVNKILNFIKSKEIGASASEIARSIKHNRVTITKYLEVMKAKGILKNKIVAQAKLWAVADDHRKQTVLIVEDEKNVLDLIKLSLIPGQYNIIEAMDGIAALKAIKEKRPNLVLLDLMIPKIDGREVCKIAKSDPSTQDIPIVMLTAKSQTLDKVEGLKVGADDYLTKPFDPLELEARVESMLKKANLHLTKNNITGLPGISVLMENLASFQGNIVLVDVKNFKNYNAAFGYKKGNELLQILSRIMKSVILKFGARSDLIAHLDSDNFVILTNSDPKQISEGLRESVDLFLPEQKKISKVRLTVKSVAAEKVKDEIFRGDIEKIYAEAILLK